MQQVAFSLNKKEKIKRKKTKKTQNKAEKEASEEKKAIGGQAL